MPVSTKKSILFARAADGKAVHQWPVAVFNEPAQAKSYAGMVKMAHSAGSDEMVKALDPAHKLDADGKPLTGVKWSIVTVPYAPTPSFEDDEVTDETQASTS
jgi:hypothetical protein